jgi:signal transduction histidine kinase
MTAANARFTEDVGIVRLSLADHWLFRRSARPSRSRQGEAVSAADAELSARYAEASRILRMRLSIAGAVIALVLIPCGSVLDRIMYPEQFWIFFWGRWLFDLVLGAILALHFLPGSLAWIKVLGFSWVMVPIVAISWMIYLTEGSQSPYYAGLLLVNMGVCTLFSWSAIEATCCCLAIFSCYLAACVFNPTPINAHYLLNNLFFIVLTAIICIIGCHFTARRRFEDFRLRNEIDVKNKELAEMDRLRSQFFANVSHELRTPLTLIIAPIEDILRRGHQLSDEVAETMEIARQNALRLLKLINDLLEMIRLEDKGIELRRETMDLGSFAMGVADSIQYLVDAKGLQLAKCPSGRPLPIFADPSRMEKIILNLITNAIKFTPKGGVITVRTESDEAHALIEIEDNGIGIPESEMKNLFSRFHQVDGSSTRKYQGIGIGLALVKELVEEHSGTIQCRSSLGRGTTMSVRLPMLDATISHPPRTSHSDRFRSARLPENNLASENDLVSEIYRSAERRGSLTLDEGTGVEGIRLGSGTHTVMVVDDEPDMRRFVVSRLVNHYRILQSDHGERAVGLALANQPDLILLDLMLPGMDGIEVCRVLRRHPLMAKTKIILLTARMNEDSKIRALEGGADDFLTKPFSILEVQTRIANLLRTADLQQTVQDRATELERALTKLKDTESQLVQSEKMSALGTVAAGLMHEVNNPLNFTLSALQVAYSVVPKADAGITEILDDIGQGMARIKGIVSDLSVFAYKSSGEENKLFNLSDVVESALRLVAYELRSVEVECSIPQSMQVQGSQIQLSHVFMNMLINSCKAIKTVTDRSPKIWISATVSQAAVSEETGISSSGGDRCIDIRVRDNGSGIPADVLPKIFEPFFTTRTVGQGTGLGLSICHTIIGNHNGTISARSEPGQWTEFTIILPLPSNSCPQSFKELIR